MGKNGRCYVSQFKRSPLIKFVVDSMSYLLLPTFDKETSTKGMFVLTCRLFDPHLKVERNSIVVNES
jgi:hypothetical protein